MSKRKPKPQTLETFKKVEPYIWLLPSALMMGIFILLPIFTVFKTSVWEVSKVGVYRGFTGLDNFKAIFANQIFWNTLKNTAIWTVVVVGLSTVFGFILGMVLNTEFKGRKFVRAVIVFPWATALIIQSVIWKYIVNADYGALNILLSKIGLIKEFINFTETAEKFFAWECWVGIFVTIPFVCFTVLSGLQSIDNSYYEAADVDGASFWDKLFRITLPLVVPSLTVSTVLNIIYVFNSFPIVWTISKGNPADQTHTLVTYLYKLSFNQGKFGEAAAVSVVGFVILAACASVYMIMTLKGEEED